MHNFPHFAFYQNRHLPFSVILTKKYNIAYDICTKTSKYFKCIHHFFKWENWNFVGGNLTLFSKWVNLVINIEFIKFFQLNKFYSRPLKTDRPKQTTPEFKYSLKIDLDLL